MPGALGPSGVAWNRVAFDQRVDLPAAHPGESFELPYGLVVQDAQIRRLLGEPSPDCAEIERRAALAVRRFVVLLSAEAATEPGGVTARD